MTSRKACLVTGARVLLKGLVNNTDLNNQLGTVMQVDAEKATVKMDSGKFVKTKHQYIFRLEEIVPLMNWGGASAGMFIHTWNNEIVSRDPVFFRQSGSNVYKYLIAKVFHVVIFDNLG